LNIVVDKKTLNEEYEITPIVVEEIYKPPWFDYYQVNQLSYPTMDRAELFPKIILRRNKNDLNDWFYIFIEFYSNHMEIDVTLNGIVTYSTDSNGMGNFSNYQFATNSAPGYSKVRFDDLRTIDIYVRMMDSFQEVDPLFYQMLYGDIVPFQDRRIMFRFNSIEVENPVLSKGQAYEIIVPTEIQLTKSTINQEIDIVSEIHTLITIANTDKDILKELLYISEWNDNSRYDGINSYSNSKVNNLISNNKYIDNVPLRKRICNENVFLNNKKVNYILEIDIISTYDFLSKTTLVSNSAGQAVDGYIIPLSYQGIMYLELYLDINSIFKDKPFLFNLNVENKKLDFNTGLIKMNVNNNEEKLNGLYEEIDIDSY